MTGSPEQLRRWVGRVVGGEVVRFDRAVARREAWLVDVDRGDAVVECFLRLGRDGDVANSPESVAREANVVRVLAATPVLVPAVLATDVGLDAALYERVHGASELEPVPPEGQQAVYRDYVTQLAALHALSVDDLGLAAFARPTTAEECALTELDVVASSFAGMFVEPLTTFGVEWLRRHVPHEVERIALVHGDAGTPNFMFDGEQVTALIDWEWAHLGDPMEDLGNAMIHASFHTSGDWPELLDCYERASGMPVDRGRVAYYRAHLMVRSVIALAGITARVDPHDPVALNLCYKIVSDRICCDAIASAMDVELERPDLPDLPERPDPATAAGALYDVVARNLRDDVRPHVDGEFPCDRLDTAVLLVETLARRQRLGPVVEAIELDELGDLLGRRPDSLGEGIAELDRAIPGLGADRELDVLRYLGRRAWRTEQLHAPVVSMFAGRELRPLEDAALISRSAR